MLGSRSGSEFEGLFPRFFFFNIGMSTIKHRVEQTRVETKSTSCFLCTSPIVILYRHALHLDRSGRLRSPEVSCGITCLWTQSSSAFVKYPKRELKEGNFYWLTL